MLGPAIHGIMEVISMFDTQESLVTFIEAFSNLVNSSYKAPYLSDDLIDNLEKQLGKTLPISFRKWMLLCNFDNFQIGTTLFGDGSNSFMEYLVTNNKDCGEYIKIAAGGLGGVFISADTGEVWSQYIHGDIANQNKLANNFEKFLTGYAFIQRNRMEGNLSLEDASKLVAEKVGSDDYRVWLHSVL